MYETQVKKIVKVQSMMRAFLAKRNVATKLQKIRQDSSELSSRRRSEKVHLLISSFFLLVNQEPKNNPSSEEAAITIQKGTSEDE